MALRRNVLHFRYLINRGSGRGLHGGSTRIGDFCGHFSYYDIMTVFKKKDISFTIHHRNIQIFAVIICTFHQYEFLPSIVNNATKFYNGLDT